MIISFTKGTREKPLKTNLLNSIQNGRSSFVIGLETHRCCYRTKKKKRKNKVDENNRIDLHKKLINTRLMKLFVHSIQLYSPWKGHFFDGRAKEVNVGYKIVTKKKTKIGERNNEME